MKFTYRLVQDKNGYLAECVETDAIGEGKTKQAAVDSLRTSLEERMFRPDAVAPPSNPVPEETIELSLAANNAERRSLDLGGPGDVAPR